MLRAVPVFGRPVRDEVGSIAMNTTSRAGMARKAFLTGTTALSLALMATAAQAQCADPTGGRVNVPGLPSSFGLPVSSSIAGAQSLVSVLTTQNTAFLTQTSGFIGAPGNPPPGTNGGGVWARGIGGTFDTTTKGSFTRDPSPTLPGLSGGCNVKTFQDYVGFQTGADISRLNIDGFNIHTGVTMGYTESSVRSQGSFRGEFQTPFVGLYGAVTKDNAFADLQARWDFVQGNLNDPGNMLSNQRLDARSFSITGNLGYNIPLNDGWFVEPSAGAVYATISVDPLLTAGPIFVAGNPSFAAPSTLRIKDFDSLMARGSLRIGRNIVNGSYALQPFITASVINEFGDPVQASVQTNFGSLTQISGFGGVGSVLDNRAGIKMGRIGTYGQFSGGLAGQLLNTGWLGYVRGDYRVGTHVDGWGVSGGVRYQFTPDGVPGLISKDAAPLLPAIDGPVHWAGVSIGGSVGGLWSDTVQTAAPSVGGAAKPSAAGVYAGGQIGADYQVNQFVFGVAGDAGFTNARGGRACSLNFLGNLFNCQSNADDLYMATGRVGYATGRSLFYAKGGAAFGHTSNRVQSNFGSAPLIVNATFLSSNVSSFSTGWTVGAGIEYALTRNWSAKAEYMHYDLGRESYRLSLANTLIAKTKTDGDLVKIGVNYRFTGDLPLATTH